MHQNRKFFCVFAKKEEEEEAKMPISLSGE
jgi:hypothetical protein